MNASESLHYQARRAIRDSDLEPYTRLLLYTMWDLADWSTGILVISLTTLEKQTGMSRGSVKRHVKKAEASGWVDHFPPAKHDAITKHEKNEYHLRVKARVTQTLALVLEVAELGPQEPQARVTVTPELGSPRPTLSISNKNIRGGSLEEGSAVAAPEPSFCHEEKTHAATPASEVNSPGCGCFVDERMDPVICGPHRCGCGKPAQEDYSYTFIDGKPVILFTCPDHSVMMKGFTGRQEAATWRKYGIFLPEKPGTEGACDRIGSAA